MEWKDIGGYEGVYQVSNDGKVRSKDRSTERYSFLQGKELKPYKNRSGYLYVDLSLDGKVSRFSVHQLVAQEFIGSRIGSAEINHKDGNKNNNLFSNLEYVTHQENTLHAIQVLGKMTHKRTSSKGERSPLAKLKELDIKHIREFIEQGLTDTQIADKFSVSRRNINMIRSRRTWNHVV